MRTEMLQKILNELRSSSGDIEGCAVISLDGLPIASSLMDSIDENRVGAMSAAMLSLGEKTSEELGRDELDQVMIKGKNGYILMVNAGNDAVLLVITNSAAKLGLIFLDTKRSAEDIAEIL
ncbi:MAG: roadblock/LC7 domain-containing protein [Proteobacteria bacterium]|nr:roadblock/LC7 domain-containing protein [Pseudomonadota bacterium]